MDLVVVRRPALRQHPGEGNEGAGDRGPQRGLPDVDVGVGGVLRRLLAGRDLPGAVEGLAGRRRQPSAVTREKKVHAFDPDAMPAPYPAGESLIATSTWASSSGWRVLTSQHGVLSAICTRTARLRYGRSSR